MIRQEKCVQANSVFEGKILSVRNDDVLDGAGKPCKREHVVHPGGACALYVEDGKVALVKQYRYAYGEEVLELPAGKLEKGEDPKLAAIRELEEETGISARAEDAELLFVLYPTPGYTNEKIYIYRAYDGERVSAHLDEDEFLDVEYIPVERVQEMLKNGEIRDAKTIIALQAYFLSEK